LVDDKGKSSISAEDFAVAVVDEIEMIYQVGNLAPTISSFSVRATAKGPDGGRKDEGPRVYRAIAFKAEDGNDDKLSYVIEFRQVPSTNWIEIAKDLAEPKYTWDTRTVGDGTYELRVTASDAPSNPPAAALKAVRLSGRVVVDNTPPVVTDLSVYADKGVYHVSGRVTDAGSRVAGISYSLDSQDKWTAVLPADGIADSPDEAFHFDLKDLEPGSHRLAVKALDEYNNAGYATATVTVPNK
jgi:hypothetical protein